MTGRGEMDAETKMWLESGLTDLGAVLDEIEADLPPDELEAWLASFQEAARRAAESS